MIPVYRISGRNTYAVNEDGIEKWNPDFEKDFVLYINAIDGTIVEISTTEVY